MTTQKNTSIGIALLGIFIVISSFGNEVSAQESERLLPCSDALSEGRVMEIDGTVTSYAIVDKHQIAFYNSNDELFACLTEREPNGQDRQHDGPQASDTDAGDGSGTDDVAGLMWQKIPDTDGNGDIDTTDKMPYDNAVARAGTSHFEFAYNDTGSGERIIDAQYASSNRYLASIAFGYDLVGNDDDTITDSATDLIWSQIDNGDDLSRKEAPAWEEAKNTGYYQDYMDSRLHNAKELQSIVDDIRSPDTTGTAAINSKFNTTSILDEADQNNYLDSDFVNNLSFMDSTNFSFVSAKETKQQYHWSSNFYNNGTAYDGMDLAFNTNIFSIDTHANIGGITGKILEMLP